MCINEPNKSISVKFCGFEAYNFRREKYVEITERQIWRFYDARPSLDRWNISNKEDIGNWVVDDDKYPNPFNLTPTTFRLWLASSTHSDILSLKVAKSLIALN